MEFLSLSCFHGNYDDNEHNPVLKVPICMELQEEDVFREVMKRGILADNTTARDPRKSSNAFSC